MSLPRPFRALSVQVLTALVVGLLGGTALRNAGLATEPATAAVEALGGLWLGGLQMTVTPLIFALLVTGIGKTADAVATGRLAARATMLFLGLILFVVVATLVLMSGVLAVWPVEAGGAQALAALAPAGAVAELVAPDGSGGLAAFLRSLSPANPIGAAAENAVLPLVIFGVFFGFAATRLPEEQRRPLVGLFEAAGEALLVIVKWVLLAAPVGVLALAAALGMKGGLGSAGALVHYVILASGACIATLLIAYPLAVFGGGVPLSRFARAAAPAQVVAVSTQSSLGTLPVMVERTESVLGVPERITGVVLPLAVAVFRLTSPAANLTVALFIAHVSGVEPTLGQFAAAGLVAVAASIASVGLPGQTSFFAAMVPISLALGVPLELLPVLLAVEVVPDIFRTVGNITADMAATTALSRGQRITPSGDTPS